MTAAFVHMYAAFFVFSGAKQLYIHGHGHCECDGSVDHMLLF